MNYTDLYKLGPIVTCLLLAIKFFYTQWQAQQTKIDSLQAQFIKYVEEDRNNLTQLVQNNTEALEQIKSELQGIKEHIKYEK